MEEKNPCPSLMGDKGAHTAPAFFRECLGPLSVPQGAQQLAMEGGRQEAADRAASLRLGRGWGLPLTARKERSTLLLRSSPEGSLQTPSDPTHGPVDLTRFLFLTAEPLTVPMVTGTFLVGSVSDPLALPCLSPPAVFSEQPAPVQSWLGETVLMPGTLGTWGAGFPTHSV